MAAARQNLASRMSRLLQAFRWGGVGEAHLPVLDAHLARLDPRAHVQLLTDDLYAPWSRDCESSVREDLEALDQQDLRRWAGIVGLLDGRLIETSAAGGCAVTFRFHEGTAVNACVGWLKGEPAPSSDDEREPDLSALHERFDQLQPPVGPAGLYHDIDQLLTEALTLPEDLRGEVDKLVESSYEHEDSDGWLRGQLPRLPRPLRNAIWRWAHLGSTASEEEGPFELDDPERQQQANCAWRLLHKSRPRREDWAVAYALQSTDSRLRAILAVRYFGSGHDSEEDVTDDGGELPADPDEVWEQLLKALEPRVRWALRFNERAPCSAAVDDPSPLVRAWHQDTPGEELVRLARHTDPNVQMGVIGTTRRARVPTQALVILSDALGVPTIPPRHSRRA